MRVYNSIRRCSTSPSAMGANMGEHLARGFLWFQGKMTMSPTRSKTPPLAKGFINAVLDACNGAPKPLSRLSTYDTGGAPVHASQRTGGLSEMEKCLKRCAPGPLVSVCRVGRAPYCFFSWHDFVCVSDLRQVRLLFSGTHCRATIGETSRRSFGPPERIRERGRGTIGTAKGRKSAPLPLPVKTGKKAHTTTCVGS